MSSEKSPYSKKGMKPNIYSYKNKKKPQKLNLPTIKDINRNRVRGRKGTTFMGGQI